LTIAIELGSLAREIGSGAAQAMRVTAGQGRICVADRGPARAGGEFGERRPGPSHSGRASEDVESLAKVVTAFIVVGRLQRGQLPDAVRVAEQGLVIDAPGPATGHEIAHLR